MFLSCGYVDILKFHAKFRSDIDVSKDSVFIEEKKPSFLPEEYSETSRLFYLCKVWGFMKYFHEGPILNDEEAVNVDSILLAAIPRSITSNTTSFLVLVNAT